MTEVKLEQSGGSDMKPDGNGEGRNLIPNADSGTPAVGTIYDPWFGATFASANYNFMYHCNYEYDRIIMGYEVIPNWATTYGRVNIMQSDTESGLAVFNACTPIRLAFLKYIANY